MLIKKEVVKFSYIKCKFSNCKVIIYCFTHYFIRDLMNSERVSDKIFMSACVNKKLILKGIGFEFFIVVILAFIAGFVQV